MLGESPTLFLAYFWDKIQIQILTFSSSEQHALPPRQGLLHRSRDSRGPETSSRGWEVLGVESSLSTACAAGAHVGASL